MSAIPLDVFCPTLIRKKYVGKYHGAKWDLPSHLVLHGTHYLRAIKTNTWSTSNTSFLQPQDQEMAEESENWRSDEHQHSHGFREQNSRDSSPKVAPYRKKYFFASQNTPLLAASSLSIDQSGFQQSTLTNTKDKKSL